MIKKARRSSLFKLSLCVSKSFLDLLFSFRPSVDHILTISELFLVNSNEDHKNNLF
ncbi:hypothetical protein Hanom_Chr06g00497921 [Helianthus anomalus]